jgi:hypothetical protein
MKKLLLLFVVMFAFVAASPIQDEEIYRIWHPLPNGNIKVLYLTQSGAQAHLDNHPGDWCHGRNCPWE